VTALRTVVWSTVTVLLTDSNVPRSDRTQSLVDPMEASCLTKAPPLWRAARGPVAVTLRASGEVPQRRAHPNRATKRLGR
jgi:hypothetical protein